MALPYLDLKGSPFEQGLQHGRALKKDIRHNLELYFERFKTEVYLERDEVLRRAALYLDAIKKNHPDYYAGMRGVAEGAGVGLLEVAALNVRYEILYYEFGVGESQAQDGCTAFAVSPGRSADGHLYIGQSWDWIPNIKGALVRSEPPDGPVSLAFTEAGIFGGKIGLNSAGVGLCINGMASLQDDWTNLELPFHARCYEVLQQTTFEAAKAVITDGLRPGSANFLVAQAPDKVVNLETAPKAVNALGFGGGVLSHANHFVDPRSIGLAEIENEFWQYSCARQARMKELLESKLKLSRDDLLGFMRDHANHPNSICRHKDPDFGPEEHYISVASVVMDLSGLKLWISDGPPCTNDFRSYEPFLSRL